VQSEKIPHAQPALHSRRAQQFAETGLKIATDTAGILGRSHSCRLGERGADGMRSCPELRERTGTSSSSRHVKEGNTKEETFTDVSILSR
jgi:hypothetical protein